jgi:hypothetical protein
MNAKQKEGLSDLCESQNNSTEQVINIMNEYSSEMELSPQLGHPIPSNIAVDTIRANVFQKNANSVFIVLTIPIESKIIRLTGECEDHSEIVPKYQVADAYGESQGFPFDKTTKMQPGDYCMGLIFENEKDAELIHAVKLEMQYCQISNLMLSQMIFGLYRGLGFDPSHVMNYPIQSVNQSVPFYRKTRTELEKLRSNYDQMRNELSDFRSNQEKIVDEMKTQINADDFQETLCQKLDELKSQITNMTQREKHVVSSDHLKREKGIIGTKSIPIEEYLKIKEERDLYHNKLHEAENYIEDVMTEQKHWPSDSYSNSHLSNGTRSIIGKSK